MLGLVLSLHLTSTVPSDSTGTPRLQLMCFHFTVKIILFEIKRKIILWDECSALGSGLLYQIWNEQTCCFNVNDLPHKACGSLTSPSCSSAPISITITLFHWVTHTLALLNPTSVVILSFQLVLSVFLILWVWVVCTTKTTGGCELCTVLWCFTLFFQCFSFCFSTDHWLNSI